MSTDTHSASQSTRGVAAESLYLCSARYAVVEYLGISLINPRRRATEVGSPFHIYIRACCLPYVCLVSVQVMQESSIKNFAAVAVVKTRGNRLAYRQSPWDVGLQIAGEHTVCLA